VKTFQAGQHKGPERGGRVRPTRLEAQPYDLLPKSNEAAQKLEVSFSKLAQAMPIEKAK
jgi:hypothetical protein